MNTTNETEDILHKDFMGKQVTICLAHKVFDGPERDWVRIVRGTITGGYPTFLILDNTMIVMLHAVVTIAIDEEKPE